MTEFEKYKQEPYVQTQLSRLCGSDRVNDKASPKVLDKALQSVVLPWLSAHGPHASLPDKGAFYVQNNEVAMTSFYNNFRESVDVEIWANIYGFCAIRNALDSLSVPPHTYVAIYQKSAERNIEFLRTYLCTVYYYICRDTPVVQFIRQRADQEFWEAALAPLRPLVFLFFLAKHNHAFTQERFYRSFVSEFILSCDDLRNSGYNRLCVRLAADVVIYQLVAHKESLVEPPLDRGWKVTLDHVLGKIFLLAASQISPAS